MAEVGLAGAVHVAVICVLAGVSDSEPICAGTLAATSGGMVLYG